MPPSAGPTVNARPNAAPIIPMARERCSGGVVSARAAWATFTVAPRLPERMRARNSTARLAARPKTV